MARVSSSVLFSLALAGLAFASPARSQALPDPTPDLALSAAFAPPRYVVRDPVQRERLRNYLKGLEGDSAQTFSLEGSTLRLSHRLALRLAALEDGDTEVGDGRGVDRFRRPRGTRLRLERMAAAQPGDIEEDAPAFPAGYRPDDLSLQTSVPQWGLFNDGSLGGSIAGVDLNMPRVWEQFDGADTLIIAVLDAGINFSHPDLQGRWFINQAEANGLPGVDDDGNGFVDDIRGWDFVDGDNDPQDFHSHGTQISGIIAASFDNGAGIAGMLPRVRILPVRVLSTAGFGNTTDIANGIRYAAAMGAHVLNFSIGVGGTTQSTVLRNAFIVARDSGMIVAAASANDAANLDLATTQPASYGFENVYVVAAHNQDGKLSTFSNYGATTVDLAAPGDLITTTTIPPGIPFLSETFESFDSTRWALSSGSWQVAPDSLEGAKSLKWVSGNSVSATFLDTVVMRGRRGGLLRFRLHFQPAHTRDGIYIDVQRKGSLTWTEVGGYGYAVAGQTVAVNLGSGDDTLFRVRFQTCALNTLRTSCTGSTAGRVLRIDDIRILHADENPANQARYVVEGGTSLAAPFFAGYAGLMRLATDRTGLPLTRTRMLAGAVATPDLAGKVITGGRLNAAKGLDFYLRTLPRILVTDSTDTSWKLGDTVVYVLSVADSAGPQSGYVLSAISSPPGSTLSAGGLFTWNPGATPQGSRALRAKAVKGPIVLRTLVTFTVGVPVGVAAAAPGQASRLRIGGMEFLLPPSAFTASSRGRHELRIAIYGPDGRTLQTMDGTLVIPPGTRMAEYDLRGVRGVGVRAWLNGVALRPASRD
jgi:subtilisin family serine protease